MVAIFMAYKIWYFEMYIISHISITLYDLQVVISQRLRLLINY